MASILVIDDDAQLRTLLRGWLEYLGHEVSEAANGRDGVELYQEQPSELVLTDVFMPEEDGLGAICALKRHDPLVRIVAMSGGGRLNGELVLELANGMGADATISKPFRIRELIDAIEAVTGGPAPK